MPSSISVGETLSPNPTTNYIQRFIINNQDWTSRRYDQLGTIKIIPYLCNLFHVYDIFGIISIRTDDFRASGNLCTKKNIVRTAPRKHKSRAQSSYLLPCITLPKIEWIGKGHGNLPATVAPPASSACLIQDPIDLVEPIQYPTPWCLESYSSDQFDALMCNCTSYCMQFITDKKCSEQG